MIRRETKGELVYKEIKRPFFETKRLYGFRAGKTSTEIYMDETQYQSLLKLQRKKPVLVMNDKASKKQWWMLLNEFWWEDNGCSSEVVLILITDKIMKEKKEIEKAKARILHLTTNSSNERQIIPDDVKMFVWQRDGGRCVKCGSQENLEYDHIIPIAKGGSNSARNIQILCENCNRSKGANLY